MTDTEIDRALALAIGWRKTCESTKTFWVVEDSGNRRVFSHKDWNVIGPIAERFGLLVDFKACEVWLPNIYIGKRDDTPQRAIALAVIGAKK